MRLLCALLIVAALAAPCLHAQQTAPKHPLDLSLSPAFIEVARAALPGDAGVVDEVVASAAKTQGEKVIAYLTKLIIESRTINRMKAIGDAAPDTHPPITNIALCQQDVEAALYDRVVEPAKLMHCDPISAATALGRAKGYKFADPPKTVITAEQEPSNPGYVLGADFVLIARKTLALTTVPVDSVSLRAADKACAEMKPMARTSGELTISAAILSMEISRIAEDLNPKMGTHDHPVYDRAVCLTAIRDALDRRQSPTMFDFCDQAPHQP